MMNNLKFVDLFDEQSIVLTSDLQPLQLLYKVLPDIKLNNIQEKIFIEAWSGRTYEQIAQLTSYDSHYLREVGHKLWRVISSELGESISKHNVRSTLQRKLQHCHHTVPRDVTPISKYSNAIPSFLPSYSPGQLNYEAKELTASSDFVGYPSEFNELSHLIAQKKYQILGLFGFGGIGKSTLARQVVHQVQNNFECIIWQPLRNCPSFDVFLTGLIHQISGNCEDPLPKTSDALIEYLIHQVKRKHCLIILDDWQALFKPGLAGAYSNSCELYGLMLRQLAENLHQSQLLVIGREQPSGIVFRNISLPVRSLFLKGFDIDAGLQMLKHFNLSDAHNNPEAFAALVKIYNGNPYALKAVSRTIQDLFGNSISKFLDRKEFIHGELQNLIHQQFSRLSEPEKLILFALVNIEQGIDFGSLSRNFWLMGHERFILDAVESLHQRSFIERQAELIRQPKIIKNYLKAQNKGGALFKLNCL
jgi:hypothetical protein